MSDDYLDRLDHELAGFGVDATGRDRIGHEVADHIAELRTRDADADAEVRLGGPALVAGEFHRMLWARSIRRSRLLILGATFAVLLAVTAGAGALGATGAKIMSRPPGHVTLVILAGLALTMATGYLQMLMDDAFGRSRAQTMIQQGFVIASVAGAVTTTIGLGWWTATTGTHTNLWWSLTLVVLAAVVAVVVPLLMRETKRLGALGSSERDRPGESLGIALTAFARRNEVPVDGPYFIVTPDLRLVLTDEPPPSRRSSPPRHPALHVAWAIFFSGYAGWLAFEILKPFRTNDFGDSRDFFLAWLVVSGALVFAIIDRIRHRTSSRHTAEA